MVTKKNGVLYIKQTFKLFQTQTHVETRAIIFITN